LAARQERSRGWIVKQALSAWIDQEEERSRLTREALGDVDAGRVIAHQAVQAWADSLDTDQPLPVPR
jgi:predicted transcriptional regulator